MLESLEVLPGARRSMRRAVRLDCHLVSPSWDEPIAHTATELSAHGMFIESSLPLSPGDEVFALVCPPASRPALDFVSRAVVRRVALGRRGREIERCGMGLELIDLSTDERSSIARALSGLPPPLRVQRRSMRREMVWVDTLLTWHEDLGDRVNTFEVSERLGALADDELHFELL